VNFRDEADNYVSLGWKVFPLQPGSKQPFEKSHGVVDASDNPDKIDAWHARCPNSNIAIACGASHLMVVDLDPRNDCWRTLEGWEKRGWTFPLTAHVRTRSGGLHLYFRLDKPLPEGWRRKLPGGVDIQVGNKYVVAPPSVIDADKVDDGQAGEYVWVKKPLGAALPMAPRWFFELLRPPPLPKFTKAQMKTDTAKRLEGAALAVSRSGKGGRNNELNKQAHLVGRLVAQRGLSEELAFNRLMQAALSTGLPQREAYATIRSGIKGGKRNAATGQV